MTQARSISVFGLAAAGLLVYASPLTAWAHEPAHVDKAKAGRSDDQIAFDLAPAPLADALLAFGGAAGVLIIFDHNLVDEFNAPRLTGRFAAPDAMALLLADAPLSYKKINQHTWVIVPLEEETPHVVAPSPTAKVARDVEPVTLRDEIIVTASYRAPIQSAGTRALYTIDSETLRLQGAINVAEPIFELPVTVSSVTSANTALFITSAGLNLADLRGLDAKRTLVLVNGRRYVRTGGGNGDIFGVDLNSIPAPFVERIEIVNQGAGAAIGADAVAGVINIVTREDIDGIALTVDGGVSERGDAGEYAVSALAGKTLWDERARFTLGVTYAEEPSLLVEERPRLSAPYGFSQNGRQSVSEDAVFQRGFGGSRFTPNGRLEGVETAGGDVVLSGDDSFGSLFFSDDGASFEPFEARLDQLYDWTTDFSALPEINRLIGYANGSVDIAPGHSLYAEAHFANTDVRSQTAASPVALLQGSDAQIGDAILVPTTNPFVPNGLVDALEAATGGPVSGLVLTRRFTELGPRVRDIERQTFQFTAGVEGPFRGEWRYDIFYQYGRNRTRDRSSGHADRGLLAAALDVDRCAELPGCTPINIFGSANITPEQAAFITAAPRERRLVIREQFARAAVSGPLYELRGETATLNAGVEYRRESLEDEAFREGGAGDVLGEFSFPGASGAVGYAELFANAAAPVLVDAPFARLFELGAAMRYVAGGEGPNFFNVSGNARWSPIEGVSLYAHAFHGGRAPNVVELFSTGPDVRGAFRDPCDAPTDEIVIANCASGHPLGVSEGFSQTANLVLFEGRGNPSLTHERVRSQNFGASVDLHSVFPNMPGGMTMSVDWWNQKATEAIGGTRGATVLSECFSSENFSSEFCGVSPVSGQPLIRRDPVTQQLSAVELIGVNQGALRVSGLDGRLQFLSEFDGPGILDVFTLDVLYSYVHRARLEGKREYSDGRLEGLVDFPRHQVHVTTSLGNDRLKTVWTVRRRGRALSTRRFDVDAARIPAATQVDASVQFRPTGNTIVFAGMENIFDIEPPIVFGANGNTFYEYYDIVGRRFFAGVKAEF